MTGADVLARRARRNEDAQVDSDERLVARMGEGDRQAVKALYRRHAAWLAARLHARTCSAELAEEALQDTFLAAWRARAATGGRATSRPGCGASPAAVSPRWRAGGA